MRKKEIEDPEIAKEAKKIRDRVEAFHREISKVGSESK